MIKTLEEAINMYKESPKIAKIFLYTAGILYLYNIYSFYEYKYNISNRVYSFYEKKINQLFIEEKNKPNKIIICKPNINLYLK